MYRPSPSLEPLLRPIVVIAIAEVSDCVQYWPWSLSGDGIAPGSSLTVAYAGVDRFGVIGVVTVDSTGAEPEVESESESSSENLTSTYDCASCCQQYHSQQRGMHSNKIHCKQ